MTIIGGHQRFKACLEMGFKEVPCVVLDHSKSKEKALNLALNKVTKDWDKKKLENILQEIDTIDFGFTGFEEDELAKIIDDVNVEAP